MKRLIIFDCFGVIFEEVAPPFIKKYLPEKEAEELKEKLFVPADKGQVSYEELLDNMAEALKLERAEMVEHWNSLFRVQTEIIPFIEKLKEKNTVALLSNAPTGVVERLFKEHNLERFFDKMVVSSAVGMVKPDFEIYEYCVSLFSETFDEVYMIDDNFSNLERLHQIGIKAVHYKGTESLEELINFE